MNDRDNQKGNCVVTIVVPTVSIFSFYLLKFIDTVMIANDVVQYEIDYDELVIEI